MLQSEAVCQINYWSLDDTIKFDDDTHQMMILSVAVPSLLFYGAVCPFLVMFYIGRHQDRQTNKKLMFRFGLFYSGFAPKYWFYELILFLRKLLIILVVTFASSNKQQLHIALGLLIVLLYLLEHLRPYSATGASDKDRVVQNRLHRMESLSLLILISMVWSAVFFVLDCNDNDGICSVLGVVVLGSNVIFALGCGYTVAKAFEHKNHLGQKLDKLSAALSLRLSGRRGLGSGVTGTGSSSSSSSSSRFGDEEIRFETEEIGGEEQDEIGCTVKINPLNSGATTRSEFAAKRRRRNSEAQREQMARSEDSSSSSNNAVTLRRSSRGAAAAVEIEMTSAVNKTTETEEEEKQ